MNSPVFVDANPLIYYLDETAELHEPAVSTFQYFIDNQMSLYTSHHVLEEVLFIVAKLSPSKDDVTEAINQIVTLPELYLIEPAPDFAFAERYIGLWQNAEIGINDALLLQLLRDSGIKRVFSFDKPFQEQAKKLGIAPYPQG